MARSSTLPRASVHGLMLVVGLGACAQVLGLDAFDDAVVTDTPGTGGTATSATASTSATTGGAGGGGGVGGVGAGGEGGTIACAGDYAALVMADGAIAHFPFDEPSGANVVASKLSSDVGTVGGTAALGEKGLLPCRDENTAADFDGESESRIDFGSPFAFDGVSAFSIEAWVTPRAYRGWLVRKFLGSDANGYALQLDGTRLYFRRYREGVAQSAVAESTSFGLNTPHHVVATYDSATMRLYVDGVERDMRSSTAPLDGGAAFFMVGAGGLDAVVDELAVYPFALEPERVAAHFIGGTGQLPVP